MFIFHIFQKNRPYKPKHPKTPTHKTMYLLLTMYLLVHRFYFFYSFVLASFSIHTFNFGVRSSVVSVVLVCFIIWMCIGPFVCTLLFDRCKLIWLCMCCKGRHTFCHQQKCRAFDCQMPKHAVSGLVH